MPRHRYELQASPYSLGKLMRLWQEVNKYGWDVALQKEWAREIIKNGRLTLTKLRKLVSQLGREHAMQRFRETEKRTCKWCGREFDAKKAMSRHQYCSQVCKQYAYYYRTGKRKLRRALLRSD